jgi:hypothetical protein
MEWFDPLQIIYLETLEKAGYTQRNQNWMYMVTYSIIWKYFLSTHHVFNTVLVT